MLGTRGEAPEMIEQIGAKAKPEVAVRLTSDGSVLGAAQLATFLSEWIRKAQQRKANREATRAA